MYIFFFFLKDDNHEDDTTITTYTCPLCLKKFYNVDVLMEHTQDCIDKL